MAGMAYRKPTAKRLEALKARREAVDKEQAWVRAETMRVVIAGALAQVPDLELGPAIGLTPARVYQLRKSAERRGLL